MLQKIFKNSIVPNQKYILIIKYLILLTLIKNVSFFVLLFSNN